MIFEFDFESTKDIPKNEFLVFLHWMCKPYI